MADDKKPQTIHLDREFLEHSAKQAAEEEEKLEATQIKSYFKDCSNPNCPVPREGPDARMHTLAQMQECLSKMKIPDGQEVEIMPGVFASNPPDLGADPPPSPEDVEEILSRISLKNEDWEQTAQGLALMVRKEPNESTVSEEEMKQAFELMNWESDRRKAEKTGRWYKVIGVLLFFLAVTQASSTFFIGSTLFSRSTFETLIFAVIFYVVGNIKGESAKNKLPQRPHV